MVRGSIVADLVPDGERHTEEALAAHTPVAVETIHPVLIPGLHVRRMPLQLLAASQELVANVERADEPLAARDDLERMFPFFVELDVMTNGTRLAQQIAAFLQQLDDARSRAGRAESGERVVTLL